VVHRVLADLGPFNDDLLSGLEEFDHVPSGDSTEHSCEHSVSGRQVNYRDDRSII